MFKGIVVVEGEFHKVVSFKLDEELKAYMLGVYDGSEFYSGTARVHVKANLAELRKHLDAECISELEAL